jgi:Polyketide cyclase / dehydrase and lipid transport
MRDLHGTAETTVAASVEKCVAFLAAVDRYPDWYPEVVKDVSVLEHEPDGRPCLVRTKLHVKRGPVAHDFELVMAVDVQAPGTVALAKRGGSEQQFDITWHARGGKETRLEVELSAALKVPRVLPLGDVGNALASGFVEAASRQLASDEAE